MNGMKWLAEHPWTAGFTIGGGAVFFSLLILDLAAQIRLSFPWSLILLASCAALAAGIALHVFDTARAADKAGYE